MAQHGILNTTLHDKEALYSAYMSFVYGGGLFVPTTKVFDLGDDVFVLVTLEDINERLPIPGTVVWITPPGAQGNRRAGIGVRFSNSQDGVDARKTIESHLAGMLNRDKPTETM